MIKSKKISEKESEKKSKKKDTEKKCITFVKDFTNLWSTKKAMEWVCSSSDVERWYKLLKIYYPKTWKRKNKVNWRELSHRVFSDYVRLYNADDEWYCRCITCWDRIYWRYIQAWHFIKRSVSKYTFDILNVYPQCMGCNCMLGWNYIIYTLNMVDKLWLEKVKDMVYDKQSYSITQAWYEENLLEWFDFIVNKLNKINDKCYWNL